MPVLSGWYMVKLEIEVIKLNISKSSSLAYLGITWTVYKLAKLCEIHLIDLVTDYKKM